MPIVQVEMISGRTLDQKRAMVSKVTDAISESLECPREAVTIVIREMEKSNVSNAGVLKSDQ